MEGNTTLGIYVALGLILLVFYSAYLKKRLKSDIVVHGIQNFLVTILWIYVVCSFALLIASVVKPEGILENEIQGSPIRHHDDIRKPPAGAGDSSSAR